MAGSPFGMGVRMAGLDLTHLASLWPNAAIARNYGLTEALEDLEHAGRPVTLRRFRIWPLLGGSIFFGGGMNRCEFRPRLLRSFPL